MAFSFLTYTDIDVFDARNLASARAKCCPSEGNKLPQRGKISNYALQEFELRFARI